MPPHFFSGLQSSGRDRDLLDRAAPTAMMLPTSICLLAGYVLPPVAQAPMALVVPTASRIATAVEPSILFPSSLLLAVEDKASAIAAAEAAIGLAILVGLFRNLKTVQVDELQQLKG